MEQKNKLIRTAVMADLEKIARVETMCFPAAEAATKAEFRERLAHYADHFWLMFEGDELIAFVDGFVTDCPDLTDEMYADASLHDENGAWQMIFGVNTIPSYRARGYAGQLIKRAISDARSQGRKGLVLTCKEALIHYYAKFGFVDEGISGSTHGNVVWHQMRLTFKKGLVLFPCDEGTRERLIQAAGNSCEFSFKDSTWSREDYQNALKAAHIIIGEPRNADFQYCENLELMHSPSSGVNYYVQGGAFPEKATLCCMTGGYGNILAEHLLGMVLALCRRLPEYRDQQHQHKWEIRKYDKQLEGSTLLVLGAGDIGTTLARWMRPMVGRIIGVRRVARDCPDCYDEMITLAELDTHLGEADIVVCALPHTPETVHLLNGERLRKMKKDAVLVNGGRGSLIDQEALCQLLDEGHFWGVGLEVTQPEPLPADHPLWDQPRVLITPHAAGNSFAPGSPLERKIWDYIISNVGGYLHGKQPQNQVDFSTGYRRTM
ncbi:MAG: GNAT family N-acetyltransferase [Oscillospiraceae bacterium]|nr:GNAT family N-acetyltransferase [Oscillospiraceae bacterium]